MDLLTQLYYIETKSNRETYMVDFLSEYITQHYPKAIITVDETNNVYVTKGSSKTYPCVVAHTDTVIDFCSNKTVVTCDNHIFGYDFVNHKPVGLGADDKNGIWVALKCLEKYDNIKCAFFTGEEIGCKGSAKADMKFFDNCRFVLQCDRRNGCDFITSIMGVDLCGNEFVNSIPLKEFGYEECNGLSTDVWKLKDRGLKVACCNMSCGYYNPHTNTECTDFSELQNCLNLVEWIIENMTDVYKHSFKRKPSKATKKYSSYEEKFEKYYHRYPTGDDDFPMEDYDDLDLVF